MLPIMLAFTFSSVNVTNQNFIMKVGLPPRMENFSGYVYMYQLEFYATHIDSWQV